MSVTQPSVGRELSIAADGAANGAADGATTDVPPMAARWVAEAERLYRRYQLEIVEGVGLCPWAARARTDDVFRARVLLGADAPVEATLEAIDALAKDPGAEVAVLIYPRLALGRAAFERFVARVRDADVPRYPIGRVPFVFAAFHPDAEPDASGAERLIPFLRRTPDPTIQLLRSDVLDRVRSGTPQGTQFVDQVTFDFNAPLQGHVPLPLRERIARANLATVDGMGITEMTRRLDAIAQDRERTYRELESAKD